MLLSIYCGVKSVDVSSPVKQDVGLGTLHHCLVDLRDILVIKLVPLTVYYILAVCNVVTTCKGNE